MAGSVFHKIRRFPQIHAETFMAVSSLGIITKYFRYLKWRNPHLYKLYGSGLCKGMPIPKAALFQYLHFRYLKFLVKSALLHGVFVSNVQPPKCPRKTARQTLDPDIPRLGINIRRISLIDPFQKVVGGFIHRVSFVLPKWRPNFV